MHTKLPDFKSARLLVVGDVMLDQYWHGSTQRISPEAPVPVVRIEGDDVRAGGAGNVALNVRAVGGNALLMGLVGDDEAGRNLEQTLSASGVDCRLHQARQGTITKLRILSRHQQLIRLDFEDTVEAKNSAAFIEAYKANLKEAACVVLSDYAKGTLHQVTELIALAREQGMPVLIDPKGTDFQRYAGATLLTPNMGEFEAVVGACKNEDELCQRAEKLCGELNLDALLVTRGEHGMTLVERGKPAQHFPAKAKEVYDVTGAGDTVVAVLGASLAAGVTMADAVALANIAAGVAVGKLGTATVSVEEIATAMEAHAPIPRGVVGEDELMNHVERARRAGERIVMTNGCFDILHPGHVAYLQQARAQGDRLVVAVNDDGSVARLKGEGRPVNPLDARMAVLAGLAAADWVVPFSEDTPERLICRVRPDVLVKGGDYQPDQIAGAQCVREAGGEVIVMPFVEGHSTTNTIRSIKGG